MKQGTTIEKLDSLLTCLYDAYLTSIITNDLSKAILYETEMMTHLTRIYGDKAVFMSFFFERLFDDKLIVKIKDLSDEPPTISGTKRIKLSPLGIDFYESGGYQHELNLKNQAKNHAEQVEKAMLANNKWTKTGTIIAGIATSFLVLIEIMKIALNNQHYPKVIEVSTFFFVFLSGVGAGTIALLIGLNVLNQRR